MHRQKKQRSGRKGHPNGRIFQEKGRLFQNALQRYRSGMLQEAELLLQSHIKRYPEDAEAINLSGLIAYQFGQYDSAIQLFQSAVSLNDCEQSYQNNLGAALKDSGDLKGAIPCFRKAIEMNPDYCEASYNLGGSYQILGELGLAIDWYEYTLSRNPEFYLAATNLACIYKDKGQIERAIEGFRHVVQRSPNDAKANSNLLFCLSYLEDVDPDNVFKHHQKWAKQHAPEDSGVSREFANDPTANRRIRVGYVSPDFRIHSVAFFIHPLIQGHDREKIEVYCYADVAKPDEVTRVMMANADQWRNIFRMSDDQVFQSIQKDQIDILVDLAGHSGNNRMKLFARKPAPVQVAYLGYPNTTGLPTMDYRISDATADPPELADPYYTEKLIRLPGGFLCYHPSLGSPDVSDTPCLKNGYITFGSFNNRAKINSKVISLWSNIMKCINNSRLILKSSISSDQSTKQDLLSLFVQNGIETDRIEILPYLPFGEHLKQYLRVDIALDTFPYNGTTTTCEALWMGVPVITLAGNTHASRVGASILGQIAFHQGIAESENDYVQKALALSGDTDFLQSWRMLCRRKMQASSLMDENGFVMKLEAAYRRIWQAWCGRMIAEGRDHADVETVAMKGEIAVCVSGSIQCVSSDILHESPDWFEQELAFIRTFLKPGMTVMDIGANYGAYTLTAAKEIGPSGSVWTFEADRLMAACLARSVHLNRLESVNLIHAGALDAGPKTLDWKPDFLRMNGQEQEVGVVETGKRILAFGSPLVLYESKNGNAFDLEMINAFTEMGYQSLRLIPGLGILAPFLMTGKPDEFQQNLFFCKADCLKILLSEGLLVHQLENGHSFAAASPAIWIDYLQAFPYVLRCLHLWQTYCQDHTRDPDWQTHQQALCAYSVSQLPDSVASDRYRALINGYALMSDLLRRNVTVSRILTAIRMAMDLGCRQDALKMLKSLLMILESSREISVDEPFLSLSARMAMIDPGSDIGQWLVYMVLETREVCQVRSSSVTDKNSLANLELMITSPFCGDKMALRRQLIRKRLGAKD
ncbi:MAG: tetratricopeptide repeat protein [Deltaproteobacteria bacterium]|nr:tetratricopeptide repeat protein [Deltaproteobacteria bacterium]